MDLVDVLRIAIGIIGLMVTAFCTIVWGELKKLRQQGHAHANRITELRMAVALVCGKIGINTKTYEDE
jgi:hypothetical protein